MAWQDRVAMSSAVAKIHDENWIASIWLDWRSLEFHRVSSFVDPEEDICLVCHGPYEESELLIRHTPCANTFHADCFFDCWRRGFKKCLICTADLEKPRTSRAFDKYCRNSEEGVKIKEAFNAIFPYDAASLGERDETKERAVSSVDVIINAIQFDDWCFKQICIVKFGLLEMFNNFIHGKGEEQHFSEGMEDEWRILSSKLERIAEGIHRRSYTCEECCPPPPRQKRALILPRPRRTR